MYLIWAKVCIVVDVNNMQKSCHWVHQCHLFILFLNRVHLKKCLFLYFWSAPLRIPSIFLKALRVIIQRATNEALLVVVSVLLWKFEMTDWFHGNPYLITDSSCESHWKHLSSFKTSTSTGSIKANRTWRSLP